MGLADIVNISSDAGRTTKIGGAAYRALKHAVVAFSACLREELTLDNVRVSDVSPGPTNTGILDNTDDNVRRSILHSRTVEWMQPEDVAEAVQFVVTRRRGVCVRDIVIGPA